MQFLPQQQVAEQLSAAPAGFSNLLQGMFHSRQFNDNSNPSLDQLDSSHQNSEDAILVERQDAAETPMVTSPSFSSQSVNTIIKLQKEFIANYRICLQECSCAQKCIAEKKQDDSVANGVADVSEESVRNGHINPDGRREDSASFFSPVDAQLSDPDGGEAVQMDPLTDDTATSTRNNNVLVSNTNAQAPPAVSASSWSPASRQSLPLVNHSVPTSSLSRSGTAASLLSDPHNSPLVAIDSVPVSGIQSGHLSSHRGSEQPLPPSAGVVDDSHHAFRQQQQQQQRSRGTPQSRPRGSSAIRASFLVDSGTSTTTPHADVSPRSAAISAYEAFIRNVHQLILDYEVNCIRAALSVSQPHAAASSNPSKPSPFEALVNPSGPQRPATFAYGAQPVFFGTNQLGQPGLFAGSAFHSDMFQSTLGLQRSLQSESNQAPNHSLSSQPSLGGIAPMYSSVIQTGTTTAGSTPAQVVSQPQQQQQPYFFYPQPPGYFIVDQMNGVRFREAAILQHTTPPVPTQLEPSQGATRPVQPSPHRQSPPGAGHHSPPADRRHSNVSTASSVAIGFLPIREVSALRQSSSVVEGVPFRSLSSASAATGSMYTLPRMEVPPVSQLSPPGDQRVRELSNILLNGSKTMHPPLQPAANDPSMSASLLQSAPAERRHTQHPENNNSSSEGEPLADETTSDQNVVMVTPPTEDQPHSNDSHATPVGYIGPFYFPQSLQSNLRNFTFGDGSPTTATSAAVSQAESHYQVATPTTSHRHSGHSRSSQGSVVFVPPHPPSFGVQTTGGTASQRHQQVHLMLPNSTGESHLRPITSPNHLAHNSPLMLVSALYTQRSSVMEDTAGIPGGVNNSPMVKVTEKVEKGEDDFGMKVLNNYVMMSVLGKGSCGKVKLAFSIEKNKTVAIKIVRRTIMNFETSVLGREAQTKLASVMHEIAVMKKLRHKNIVSLYEVIDDPEAAKLYLVMQYVDRGCIGSLRDDGTCERIPSEKLLDIARQAAAGLEYLHSHGVLHHDIKPENILIDSDERVYLSDFGVSAASYLKPEDGPEVSAMGGTPLFMPPEAHVRFQTSRNKKSQAPSDTASQGDTSFRNSSFLPVDSKPSRRFYFGVTMVEDQHSSAASPLVPFQQGSQSSIKSPREPSPAGDEEIAPQQNGAWDVWSLGVTLYTLLVGHIPFHTVEEVLSYNASTFWANDTVRSEVRRCAAGVGGEALAPTNVVASIKANLWIKLFQALLQEDPTKRPSVREVKQFIKRKMINFSTNQDSAVAYAALGGGGRRRSSSVVSASAAPLSHVLEDHRTSHVQSDVRITVTEDPDVGGAGDPDDDGLDDLRELVEESESEGISLGIPNDEGFAVATMTLSRFELDNAVTTRTTRTQL